MDKLPYNTIILTAGSSERMGFWKPVLPYKASTLIETIADQVLDFSTKVIVVGGYRGSELQALFSSRVRIEYVMNFNHLDGLFSSIQAALPLVDSSWFFVALGDMPFIRKETFFTLARASRNVSTLSSIFIPEYSKTKGHPVLFNSALIPDILNARGYKTMREYPALKSAVLVPVDDPGVIMDIDTPEDYQTFSWGEVSQL